MLSMREMNTPMNAPAESGTKRDFQVMTRIGHKGELKFVRAPSNFRGGSRIG